jgi:hypothetical protein
MSAPVNAKPLGVDVDGLTVATVAAAVPSPLVTGRPVLGELQAT